MREPHLIYILVWVVAIERSRLAANLQRAEMCFDVDKGVSESKDINAISEIRSTISKIISLKLLVTSKLP